MPGRAQRFVVGLAGGRREVAVEPLDDGRVRVTADGDERVIALRSGGTPGTGPSRLAWIDGLHIVEAEVELGAGGKLTVALKGQAVAVEVGDAASVVDVAVVAHGRVAAGPLTVRAPMPGRVVKVLVAPGEAVDLGRGLVVVEAMKMENEIRAQRAGRVGAVLVSEGGAVEAGQELVVLE